MTCKFCNNKADAGTAECANCWEVRKRLPDFLKSEENRWWVKTCVRAENIDAATAAKYPEHAKFRREKPKLEAAKAFLSFIQNDEELQLTDPEIEGSEMCFTDFLREALIFRFIGIDHEAFRREKDAMVEDLRAKDG